MHLPELSTWLVYPYDLSHLPVKIGCKFQTRSLMILACLG
jgi:hypothetical protein